MAADRERLVMIYTSDGNFTSIYMTDGEWKELHSLMDINHASHRVLSIGEDTYIPWHAVIKIVRHQ